MIDDHVIATAQLTKRYGERILAVDDLNLRVRRGEVYGFVGPNGAGKTTTLKMLAGLIRPSSGTACILGHLPGSREAMAHVGAMIEAPAFYPYLSGLDNLRFMALHAGVPHARIANTLAQVGLSSRADDHFATYSTGMKQRLGLAAALLKDPDVLILDEPTSGLDPEGIAEMRALIRSLGQGRRTVFLSSHLMTEVEQTCDQVGIIRQGRLVGEGTLAELRGTAELRVRATPIDRARALIAALPYVNGIRTLDGVLVLATDPDHAGELNRQLLDHGVEVSELTPVHASLEQVYLDLVHVEGADTHG